MDIFKIKGVRIDGVVSCVPEREIDNEAALQKMYSGEAKLIIESTGIRKRFLANQGTTSSDLCIAAAEKVMEGTNTAKEEIGGVIFVTFTPDRRMPFNASLVQERMGLSREIPAFDISLACSGYAYGLYAAAAFCRACGRKILLLDGDVQSAFTSPYDKGTVPVLADAGSATLLSFDGSDTEWDFSFYTDGSGREVLTIPAGGSESPETEEDLVWKEMEEGSRRRNIDIRMDGFAVFRFVAIEVAGWLKRFMEELGESAETIDSFVPHQANMYMIKKLAKKLKFPWENTWQSGAQVGNSASATIPVTISYDVERRMKKDQENKVLISGFGAGLSAGAALITLDPGAHYEFFHFQKE